MNAQQFLDLYGWKRAERVAADAGTTRAYFWQVATGRRNASPALAVRIVRASGGEIDFHSLVWSTAERRASLPGSDLSSVSVAVH